jgi:hypothetical protein
MCGFIWVTAQIRSPRSLHGYKNKVQTQAENEDNPSEAAAKSGWGHGLSWLVNLLLVSGQGSNIALQAAACTPQVPTV